MHHSSWEKGNVNRHLVCSLERVTESERWKGCQRSWYNLHFLEEFSFPRSPQGWDIPCNIFYEFAQTLPSCTFINLSLSLSIFLYLCIHPLSHFIIYSVPPSIPPFVRSFIRLFLPSSLSIFLYSSSKIADPWTKWCCLKPLNLGWFVMDPKTAATAA